MPPETLRFLSGHMPELSDTGSRRNEARAISERHARFVDGLDRRGKHGAEACEPDRRRHEGEEPHQFLAFSAM